ISASRNTHGPSRCPAGYPLLVQFSIIMRSEVVSVILFIMPPSSTWFMDAALSCLIEAWDCGGHRRLHHSLARRSEVSPGSLATLGLARTGRPKNLLAARVLVAPVSMRRPSGVVVMGIVPTHVRCGRGRQPDGQLAAGGSPFPPCPSLTS